MTWNFQEIQEGMQKEVAALATEEQLEAFRVKFLGRKGVIAEIYDSLANLSKEEKPVVGKKANELRAEINRLLEIKKQEIKEKKVLGEPLDVTIPGVVSPVGHKHILTQTIDEICGLFESMGFIVREGPEIETEFNNFAALNIPLDHPSRDAFDTFYLQESDPEHDGRYLLLRSHTSPGQIRIMKEHKPPLAVVIPGKVYRPDAVDASHSFMFHQIEGLLVDQEVKFSDLKGLLTVFCKKLFGEDIKMRFRPHFFPFTEPSAEVDISCYICQAKGCSVCGRKGWLEIMGCGMVHPKVFEAVGYAKGKYTGLAFGLGVERIAMLKYGIQDIRLFFENDFRFLKQF
ncbi:MAG: phenylalanine--tRNA ligase subunit alpha [Omnitrophica WOR_2 bacterium GWC2_45_7]|nr:MAG: phenylalanine--tRNA ligase subunit alpha [Omnitrophica WOR_2 bacterium GWC2_45_7]